MANNQQQNSTAIDLECKSIVRLNYLPEKKTVQWQYVYQGVDLPMYND